MKATWDDSDSDFSDDDSSGEEVANICLIAHLSEVDNNHNSCIYSKKYDELQSAFGELHEELENLGTKRIALKKNFSMLSNELNDLKIQNDLLKKGKWDS